jgi:general secretion pathway protein G
MEVLLVLAILVILGSMAGVFIAGMGDRAYSDAAKTQIRQFEQHLKLYRLDMGAYPTTELGLNALVVKPGDSTKWRGPYTEGSQIPPDPWGNPYQYQVNAAGVQPPVKIWSWGPDLQDGTEDDVTNDR